MQTYQYTVELSVLCTKQFTGGIEMAVATIPRVTHRGSHGRRARQVLTPTTHAARPRLHKRTAQIHCLRFLLTVSPSPRKQQIKNSQERLLTVFEQQLKALRYTHQFEPARMCRVAYNISITSRTPRLVLNTRNA